MAVRQRVLTATAGAGAAGGGGVDRKADYYAATVFGRTVRCQVPGRILGLMTRQALLEEALKLPHSERADVAAELLASLDGGPETDDPDEIERAWTSEIERRARRALAGETAGVAWEEVKQRIERRLAE